MSGLKPCPFCGNPINNKYIEIAIFKELEQDLQEQVKINEFYKKSAKEQMQLLLTKYWLIHSNDTVYEQFGCNYVPCSNLQEKARDIIDINSISLTNEQLRQINKSLVKNVMQGYLNYTI